MSKSVVNIAVIGVTGGVGRTLVKQLQARASWLATRGVSFGITAVTNSKKMVIDMPDALLDDQPNYNNILQEGLPLNLETFMESLRPKSASEYSVMFDCTASEAVAGLYLGAVNSGVHVITPNKRLTSAALTYYQAVQQAQFHKPDGSLRPAGHATRVFYEAAVGGGLPIITTLQDMISTGDPVYSIKGTLSGTLSHLFNTFGPGQSFAQLVKDARAQGFTEPDPREDLCGMDVARKALTMARECGLTLELDEVEVESLIPAGMASDLSTDEFLQELPKYDGEMLARVQRAAASDRVLRYVGEVDVAAKKCRASLQEFPKDHAFAQISGTDSIFQFCTERYTPTPLTIRGPGAGLELTAGAVFGDYLRLLQSLGFAV